MKKTKSGEKKKYLRQTDSLMIAGPRLAMIELSCLARRVLLGTSTPVATSNTIPATHNPRGRAIWTLRTSHLAGWAKSRRSAATGSYRTSGSATCPPPDEEEGDSSDDDLEYPTSPTPGGL